MTDHPMGGATARATLAERQRILDLAAELERFGKLTADNLRTFAEMRLEVSQPKVGIVETLDGDKIEYEIKQLMRVDSVLKCVHCGEPTTWDKHSSVYLHVRGGYHCDDTRTQSAEPVTCACGQTGYCEAGPMCGSGGRS